MHPFLDTSKLSDEDIIEKLRIANNVLNYQTAMGHEPTVRSIKEVISALEEEKNTRSQKMILDQTQKKESENPGIIEIGKLEQ